MNIITGIKNILFDQKAFFENAPKGLGVPVLVTAIYAVVSLIIALQSVMEMSSMFGDMGAFVIGISAVTTIITVFVTWLLTTLFFFACLKLIGYAKCSFKEVLNVVSYGAIPLTIYAVIVGLVSLIGTPDTLATLILSGVILLWTIPIWLFGFESITDIPRKKIVICILIPVAIMVIISVVSFLMTATADPSAMASANYEFSM